MNLLDDSNAVGSLLPSLSSQVGIENLLASLQKQVAISDSIFSACQSLKAEAAILAVNKYGPDRHLQTENLFQRRRFVQNVNELKAQADAYFRPYDQVVRYANTAVKAMGHRPMHGYLCLVEIEVDNRFYLSGVDWLEEIEFILDTVICAVEKQQK